MQSRNGDTDVENKGKDTKGGGDGMNWEIGIETSILLLVCIPITYNILQQLFCCLVTKSCLNLATPWTVTRQAPLFMGFPKQEHWNGLPFLSARDLPDPGIEPASPALQADPLPLSHDLNYT